MTLMLLCGTTARRIEDGEEATFEIVSGVLGPEFALQASGKPELLQKSQRLLVSALMTAFSSSTEASHASRPAL